VQTGTLTARLAAAGTERADLATTRATLLRLTGRRRRLVPRTPPTSAAARQPPPDAGDNHLLVTPGTMPSNDKGCQPEIAD
jgi:hypothetical protein